MLVSLTGSKVAEGIADMELNTQGTLLASAPRTAGVTSPNMTNYNARGIVLFLNVTAAPAAPGAGGLTPRIAVVDPISGSGANLTPVPTLVTAVGLYSYVIYPGASAAALTGAYTTVQQVATVLPRLFNANVGHGDAQSYTYSLGYSLIL